MRIKTESLKLTEKQIIYQLYIQNHFYMFQTSQFSVEFKRHLSTDLQYE